MKLQFDNRVNASHIFLAVGMVIAAVSWYNKEKSTNIQVAAALERQAAIIAEVQAEVSELHDWRVRIDAERAAEERLREVLEAQRLGGAP